MTIAQRRLVVLIILSCLGIFLPSLFGLDGFDGGYAISTIALVLFLSFGLSALVIRRAAKQIDDMLAGKDLIVHWSYSQSEWRAYTEAEHITDVVEKKIIFYLIAGMALLIGIGFLIYDREAGKYVFFVMISLIVLIGFIAWWSAKRNYRNNLGRVGETYIGKHGVLLNGNYSSWTSFGARFEAVELHSQSEPKVLSIFYSLKVKNGRNTNEVRIPIPETEKNVEKVISALNNLIN